MQLGLSAIAVGLAIGVTVVADVSQVESDALDIGKYVAQAIGTGGSASQPSSACSKVADVQASVLEEVGEDSDPTLIPLDARLAFDCVKSVQLVATDALQLIEYAKQYWQFQTTLSYMKTPTEAYQEPPVDIMARLDALSAQVSAGKFSSQYDFDYEIYRLVADSHEGHFNLVEGVLGQFFKWRLPVSLATALEDGAELPKVFVWQDIINTDSHPNSSWTPSAVLTIGGQSTVDYVASLSQESIQGGVTEAHAEWNVIMQNPAFSFGNKVLPYFVETSVYRGESVKGMFENGTEFEWPFVAAGQVALKANNFSSPEEMYTNGVLAPTETNSAIGTGVPPASATATSTSLPFIPYPNYPKDPVVRQQSFGPGAGTVSGYLLKDVSVGIISIPSFETGQGQFPEPSTFSKAISDFLQKSKQAGMEKIVIDISGNGGGTAFQAYDSFKRFFPTVDSSQLFRTRATAAGDTFGKILSAITRNDGNIVNATVQQSATKDYGIFAGFNAALTLDEDSKPFTSWNDFYGPVSVHGDKFTRPGRFDFANPDIDFAALDEFVFGFGNNTGKGLNASAAYKASEMIILSDGQCGSTCAIFSELMRTQAGVKFVAVGGTPTFGPMQAVAGTRGSSVLQWDTIDGIVQGISSLAAGSNEHEQVLTKIGVSKSDLETLPPPLSELRYRVLGRFNALDIVRPGEDTPLQFTYEPADCRLFYTMVMIRQQSEVWKAAAKIIDGDFSACVEGSTERGAAGTNVTLSDSPGFNSSFEAVNTTWKGNATWGSRNSAGVASLATAALPGATGSSEATNSSAHGGVVSAPHASGGQRAATKTGPKPTVSPAIAESKGSTARSGGFVFATAVLGFLLLAF